MKRYQYRYHGTYAQFAAQVYFPSCQMPLEFDGYQLKRNDKGLIQFGLGQAGHGAGHWYEHTIRQVDGALIFTGEIVCKNHDGTIVESTPWTWKDWLWTILCTVLFFPILLPFWICSLFRPGTWESNGKRLDRLMTECFHCEKIT